MRRSNVLARARRSIGQRISARRLEQGLEVAPRDDLELIGTSYGEPGFVSRSATNMHGTSTFWETQVRSVDSLMSELGHERVDLLKLSVEGSEYEIVGEVLRKELPVGVMCVEFAQPSPLGPIRKQIGALEDAGYELV